MALRDCVTFIADLVYDYNFNEDIHNISGVVL